VSPFSSPARGPAGRRIALLALVATAGCREREAACTRCDTLVIAATGEPETLLPPLVRETVGRDVGDFVYEHLMTLAPGGSSSDPGAFEPGLAASWSRIDARSLRFDLRPDALWQDGKPVTPGDVAFSFRAYTDTLLGASGSPQLDGVRVDSIGPHAVRIQFPTIAPDQLFDAIYYVRIIPQHLLDSIPRNRWGADSSRAIGSGRFKVGDWRRGQSLTLERVRPEPGGINRIVWRFGSSQDAALNLVLSHEADALETLTSPSAKDRARADSSLALIEYPSAVSGFLAFRVADASRGPHPILADRAVRRALTLAVERPALVKAVLGDAVVPPGPISRATWIWNDSVRVLGYEPAQANRLLDSAGWTRGSDGIRRKGSTKLALDILVPSTSGVRRQLAEGIQQQWKAVGVAATITAVDFPVFQERLAKGRFDAMIGAYLDEPSPKSLGEQWTRLGNGIQNPGRYDSPPFDSLFAQAVAASSVPAARGLWRLALDSLNADPPAIFLYTPTNVAVVSKRVRGITVDPFSWLATADRWHLVPPR
jgi:peptide/nickel transport system substrate-binding protein